MISLVLMTSTSGEDSHRMGHKHLEVTRHLFNPDEHKPTYVVSIRIDFNRLRYFYLGRLGDREEQRRGGARRDRHVIVH